MTVLLVFLGGVLGAPLRYLIDRAVTVRLGDRFPFGTLLVNLSGCLLLGLLAGAGSALPGPIQALAATGFCGALTTYSTFSWEALCLARRRAYLGAAMYVTLSVTAGIGAALFGAVASHALLS